MLQCQRRTVVSVRLLLALIRRDALLELRFRLAQVVQQTCSAPWNEEASLAAFSDTPFKWSASD